MASEKDALAHLLGIVMVPQARTLVLHCRQGCRGVADRIRGIPFAAILAYLSGRQLIVDRSYLSYVPSPPDGPDYRFDDDCATPGFVKTIRNVLAEASPTVFIKSSCFKLPMWDGIINGNDDRLPSLAEISQLCSQQMEDAYRCGAAAFRASVPHVTELHDGFAAAHRAVEALQPFLSSRNYTVIQIRAGGSTIDVGGTAVAALSWGDAYISESPNLWVEAFQKLRYSDCRKSIVVLSDSARILSEIRHAARDRLMVINCCNQPLHRDQIKSRPYEFYLQEVVELLIMASAQKIVAGQGNFVTLGRYWLQREGPQLVRAETAKAINDALFHSLKECECQNIARPPKT